MAGFGFGQANSASSVRLELQMGGTGANHECTNGQETEATKNRLQIVVLMLYVVGHRFYQANQFISLDLSDALHESSKTANQRECQNFPWKCVYKS